MNDNPFENMRETRLNSRLDALELMIENMPVAVGLFEINGRPVVLNRAFRALYNSEERWHEDITFAEMISSGAFWDWKADPQVFLDNVVKTLRRDGVFTARNQIGDRIVSIHDVLLDDTYILTTQEDITDKVQAEKHIAFLASHDTLTELPNRSMLNSTFDNVIEEARARHEKFSVLLVDIDRFKDINDLFGHAAGDAVLSEMAGRFNACLGAHDNVARLGGDEFCFLSLDGNQPESARALAERLSEAARAPVMFEGRSLKVGLSIGLAVFPTDGQCRRALLSSADAALYRAKAEGRGTIRAFEPDMDRRLHDQRLLQADLRLAIDREELRLCYQPQASITGEIYGFEVLLRWQHPTRGLLGPDLFIPIAEESGLILEIGEWVLRNACAEAARWKKPLKLSVNLSVVQFRHDDLVQMVHRLLVETGLNPSRLELEITESVLVRDFARALHILRQLKSLGVQIAMDDFGTGYSSLSYLQSFPFDTLKIDRSFIDKLSKDRHTDEIVRAVIGLGRGLNIPVVAEGVETEEQQQFLERERCDSMQGYLIGKAMPIETYADMLSGDQTRRDPEAPAPQALSA